MFDGKAFGDEIVATVKSYLKRQLTPVLRELDELRGVRDENKALVERIAALENAQPLAALVDEAIERAVGVDRIVGVVADQVAKAIEALPPAEPGKDADPAMVAQLVDDTVSKAVAALPPPQAGRDADMEAVADIIADQVTKAVSAIPPAEPGRDADPALVAELVGKAVAEAVAALPEPAPGRDADMEAVAKLIADEVGKAVAAIPPAAPGRDADPADIARAVDEAVAKAVAALPAPAAGRDVDMTEVEAAIRSAVVTEVGKLPVLKGDRGEGVADLLIDRHGQLVATFTDGRTKEMGQIVGGDGKDGLSADDVSCALGDDGRTVTFKLARGEVARSFELTFPVVLDRGVYQERDYRQGDAVTWAGSLWIAQRDTSAKPDSPDSGWRLAVKRGRDGKDRPA